MVIEKKTKKNGKKKLYRIMKWTLNLSWGFGFYLRWHKMINSTTVKLGKSTEVEFNQADVDMQWWEINIAFMMFLVDFRWKTKLTNSDKVKISGFYSDVLPERFNTKFSCEK